MKRTFSRGSLLLAAAWAIAWLPVLPSARIVRDDWANLITLRDLFGAGFLRAFWAVCNNDWVRSPRVFWSSWEIQGALAPLFGLTPLPYYLLAFAAHGLTAWLLYCALARLLVDERAALLAAMLAMLHPAATTGVLFLNNWFFVLPCVLLATVLERLSAGGSSASDVVILAAAGVLGQFGGEMTLPAFYALFAWFLIHALRVEKRSWRDPEAARAWIPLVVCGLILLAYLRLYVAPYASQLSPAYTWDAIPSYLAHVARLGLVSSVPLSRFYGQLSIAPSAGTIAASLALAGVMWTAAKLPSEKASPRSLRRAAALLGAAATACLVPLVYGVASGFRPIPETRYLYPLGILLPPALALALSALLAPRLRALALAVAAWAAGSLALYQGRDVWGAQKRLDARIWAAVDAELDPGVRHIVMDGQERGLLMPGFHSDAVSDFHASYGVSTRLLGVHGHKVDVACGLRPSERHNEARLVPCPGGQEWSAPESAVLAVALRHGPRFADLVDGEVRVFRRLADYRRWRGEAP